jgi:hypothetical protein
LRLEKHAGDRRDRMSRDNGNRRQGIFGLVRHVRAAREDRNLPINLGATH